MNSIFDPLLGRLRTTDTTTNQIIKNVMSSGGGSQISTGTTVPNSGTDGDMFYDTDDGILYVYANGAWNAISGGGGSSTPATAIEFIDGTFMEFVDGSGYAEYIA